MPKQKKMQKEYAVVVSLIIFFTVIIVTGGVRILLLTKDKLDLVDLTNINIVETNTNVDISSYNLRIANSIRQKYDIDINYGNTVDAESVDAVPVADEMLIFSMLKMVNEVLSKYPENLIREIEKKGYELSINLVDHFNTNVEALANRNSIGQMKIYISNTTDLIRAIHHEYYHILDYYIRLETDENIAYLNWSKYNPKGFEYSENINEITAEYVYDGSEGAYFVTPYAKYSDKEDRAETFAEMITASKTEVFFNENGPIKGKMNIIRSVLKNTFQSIRVESNLAWN